MLLTRKLRPVVWCAFGIFAFSSCRQEVAEPTHPVLSTDHRLTSVVLLDGPGTAPNPLPFWRAEYYPDGSIKSLSDDRDSSYVAYAYAGREIIGKDISTHDHWPPFTDYRLQLDDQRRVTASYHASGSGNWYDSTTYASDQAGYLVEQVRKLVHQDGQGTKSAMTTTINHQFTGGNPVVTTVTETYPRPDGQLQRDRVRLIMEYYPDQKDQNNIQAFFRLRGYGSIAPVRHVPFFKSARNLLKKVYYVNSNDVTVDEMELSYQWDGQGKVTRITVTTPNGSPVQYGLHYNGQ